MAHRKTRIGQGLLIALGLLALPTFALAQGNDGGHHGGGGSGGGHSKAWGTVTLTGDAIQKVTPSGYTYIYSYTGYYQPTSVTVNVQCYNIKLADKSVLTVTLRYPASCKLAPVKVGTMQVSHGQAILDTTAKPSTVLAATPVTSMVIEDAKGDVVLSGNISH